MMQYTFAIAELDLVANYEYRITAEGCRETGPTYDCGGQPAEPMEYEITVESVHEDKPGGTGPALELPAWMKNALENIMVESDAVYDAICKDRRQ